MPCFEAAYTVLNFCDVLPITQASDSFGRKTSDLDGARYKGGLNDIALTHTVIFANRQGTTDLNSTRGCSTDLPIEKFY